MNKLKAAGVGLLAIVAAGAVAVMGASANTGGHFVSEVSHTIVSQMSQPGAGHEIKVKIGTTELFCDEASVIGTATSATVTEVQGVTTLKECHTTDTEPGTIIVHMNGCEARGTIAPGNVVQTNDLICPSGKVIEVTHPNCNITVPPQNNISGFTYTTIVENGKHVITLDVNLEYKVQYHSGLCIFLGTNQTAIASGGTIIRGKDTNGNPVGITAT